MFYFCSCLILHPGYVLIKLSDARHLLQAFLSTDVHLHVIWQCNFHACWSYDFWTIHSWTWIRTIRPSNSHVCVRGTVATALFFVFSSSAIMTSHCSICLEQHSEWVFLTWAFCIIMQISPTAVRGTYGSLLQIATCVGIFAALVAGLPAPTVPGWYAEV